MGCESRLLTVERRGGYMRSFQRKAFLLIAVVMLFAVSGMIEAAGAQATRDFEVPEVKLTDLSSLPDNSIKGPQYIDIGLYRLKVYGNVSQEISYSYEDIIRKGGIERYSVLYCVEGWDASVLWVGTRIMDLISTAGIKDGSEVVIFHSSDGYTTSLPISEIKAKEMIVAYRANNAVLPIKLGFPLIVVAEDKLGYKWARWVIGMEISTDSKYLGYWEEIGFPNDAEVKPK